jgi:hypothetical protein
LEPGKKIAQANGASLSTGCGPEAFCLAKRLRRVPLYAAGFASAARIRAQLRAPFSKLRMLYFSFGE